MPRGVKLAVPVEEMLAMRNEKKMSNKQIADEVGVHPNVVLRHIGKQPEWMTHANQVAAGKQRKKPTIKTGKTGRKNKPRTKVTNEELLRLRAEGLSDKAIAAEVGCSPCTVSNRIGRRPAEEVRAERQERAKKARAIQKAKRAGKQPETTQKEPEIVVKPQETAPVELITPPTPVRPQKPEKVAEMIPTDLFALAYIPSWYEQLHDLAEMAQPEPWKFKKEYPNKNLETPILGAYINRVYRRLAILRNATPAGEDNECIYIRGQVLCFHTGLYTPLYKGIYALFRPNPRPSLQKWYFEGFFDEISSRLKAVHPLPKSLSELEPRPNNYDPHKPIRVNVGHMIETGENLARLPESIRDAWNLPLLLETAVELSRRKTCIEPGLVSRTRAPQSDAYALPLWLTNMDTPDAAVLLEDMGDYYAARTNLTLEQAYLDARQNGRPTAKWLTDLVE